MASVQRESPVSVSIFARARGIGAGCGTWRRLDVPVAQKRVLSDRAHDLPPLLVLVESIDFPKGLVDVGHGRYERRASVDGSLYRLPVERVAPSVMLVS